MKKCKGICRYISAYIDRDLDDMMRDRVRAHLAECERCLVLLHTMEKTLLLFREFHREEEPPVILIRRISCQVHLREEQRACVVARSLPRTTRKKTK